VHRPWGLKAHASCNLPTISNQDAPCTTCTPPGQSIGRLGFLGYFPTVDIPTSSANGSLRLVDLADFSSSSPSAITTAAAGPCGVRVQLCAGTYRVNTAMAWEASPKSTSYGSILPCAEKHPCHIANWGRIPQPQSLRQCAIRQTPTAMFLQEIHLITRYHCAARVEHAAKKI